MEIKLLNEQEHREAMRQANENLTNFEYHFKVNYSVETEARESTSQIIPKVLKHIESMGDFDDYDDYDFDVKIRNIEYIPDTDNLYTCEIYIIIRDLYN